MPGTVKQRASPRYLQETNVSFVREKSIFYEIFSWQKPLHNGGAFYLYVALPKLKNEYADQLDGKTYARLEFMLQIKIDGAFSLKEQEYRLHFFLNVDLYGNVEESKFDSVTLMRVKEKDR